MLRARALLCVTILAAGASTALAQNQTPDLSPVLDETGIPIRISIAQADFVLPSGVQSYVSATSGGRWLILGGRSNGLHGFGTNTFPANQQNTSVYVVDPGHKTVATRSLTDPQSGLSQAQIDDLSATSQQAYQLGNTLYVSGGYGVDTATSTFSTRDALTAIDVSALMQWVVAAPAGDTAAAHIRQMHDSIFQVTGGDMRLGADGITLLMLGQNFIGDYVGASNGTYLEQIRRFRIVDNGIGLSVVPAASVPTAPDADYRRRDLNIVPIVQGRNEIGWTALAGVFTPGTGIWTVPVDIAADGTPAMADPSNPNTFKQAMNQYASATAGMYSSTTDEMYTLLFGGISFGYFDGSTFETDAELPFINEVTTIRRDADGSLSQYLMSGTYPVIASAGSNPGNPLLFGAGAHFFPASDIAAYANGVLNLDPLGGSQPHVIGYIVGGIMSTLPNTNTQTDSAASPYIFAVTLTSSLALPPPVPSPLLDDRRLLLLGLLVLLIGARYRSFTNERRS